MDTISLETFVTLVSTGSYTKTAQIMSVVQSTISKRIRELENEVGKELLIRDKKSIILTPVGKTVYNYAMKMTSLKEECDQEIRWHAYRNNRLKVGCVPSLFEMQVSGRMAQFMKENPGIFVEFITKSSKYLLNELTDNRLDLCFTYQPFYEKNFECIPFIRDEMILVESASMERYRSGVTDEQLKRLTLLHENLTCVSDSRIWFSKIFQENSSPRMFIGTNHYMIPFLKEGLGCGFVVKRAVEEELKRGELIEIPLLEKKPPKLQSYIVYRSGDSEEKKQLLRYLQRN